jgi:hypothetical protein
LSARTTARLLLPGLLPTGRREILGRRKGQTVSTGIAGEVNTASEITIATRTRLMLHWAEVAIEQERSAREAREQLERDHAAGENLRLSTELHPAMIAVAACAHSLDALYAELAEHVGPETLVKWEETRRGGRWAEIAGVLELSFAVEVDPWRSRLRTLFVDRRNPAIHPKAKFKPAAKHPTLPTNVAAEYVVYSIESAKESLDLLLEILSACIAAPRPALEAWANDAREPVERLNELRATG